jgi:hypothetical protein
LDSGAEQVDVLADEVGVHGSIEPPVFGGDILHAFGGMRLVVLINVGVAGFEPCNFFFDIIK